MSVEWSIRDLYTRRGEPVKGLSVVSFDIGTSNFIAMRTVREEATGKVYMTHAAHLRLCKADETPTIDVVCNNAIPIFMQDRLEWIWRPQPGQTNDMVLVPERQMDHIQGQIWQIDEKTGQKKKAKYKPPIMYAIYGILRLLANVVQAPAVFIKSATLLRIMGAGIELGDLGEQQLQVLPVTGGQKVGLKDKRGRERKGDEAVEVAIRFMEQEGDEDGARFMETRGRDKDNKPLQDFNDAYLQARYRLCDLADIEHPQLDSDEAGDLEEKEDGDIQVVPHHLPEHEALLGLIASSEKSESGATPEDSDVALLAIDAGAEGLAPSSKKKKKKKKNKKKKKTVPKPKQSKTPPPSPAPKVVKRKQQKKTKKPANDRFIVDSSDDEEDDGRRSGHHRDALEEEEEEEDSALPSSLASLELYDSSSGEEEQEDEDEEVEEKERKELAPSPRGKQDAKRVAILRSAKEKPKKKPKAATERKSTKRKRTQEDDGEIEREEPEPSSMTKSGVPKRQRQE